MTNTPGPWKVEADYADDTGAEYVIIGADGSCVTYMDGDGNERIDAGLIAASPKLLAALRWFVDEIAGVAHPQIGIHYRDELAAAREAIAMAEGGEVSHA